ncbi:MAG: galactose mutarotase [Clostridiales bacterium]|nr:galactose mutarotase [Clostridiales bacterium]
MKEEKENKVYTLSNNNGFEVDVLDYGARIISARLKNTKGAVKEFIVGPENPEDYYLTKFSYSGATIGRYANRIGEAKFNLNGKEYLLNANQNGHCLHGGGDAGFHNKIWDSYIENNSLVLKLNSPDGAGGFPGNMTVTVKYSVDENNCLNIEYFAQSDKDTHCCLTNHAYFNLNDKDTRGLYAYINSDTITKLDKDFVARGEYCDIIDTPYSFNPEKQIGKDISSDDYFIQNRSGYDTNYCIKRNAKNNVEFCAYVCDKESGMKIECYSTMPGLQFYATKNSGKLNEQTKDYNGFCLEPQYYPNSPNCPTYPTTLLKKDEDRFCAIKYNFFC